MGVTVSKPPHSLLRPGFDGLSLPVTRASEALYRELKSAAYAARVKIAQDEVLGNRKKQNHTALPKASAQRMRSALEKCILFCRCAPSAPLRPIRLRSGQALRQCGMNLFLSAYPGFLRHPGLLSVVPQNMRHSFERLLGERGAYRILRRCSDLRLRLPKMKPTIEIRVERDGR